MTRNIIYRFDDVTSVGLNFVPRNQLMIIEDLLGVKTYLRLLSTTTPLLLTNTTTVQELIDNPSQYEIFLTGTNTGDEVHDYTNLASLPATGEESMIYITTDDSFIHRWNGASYDIIGGGLERGGIAWEDGIQYKIDDIAVISTIGYVVVRDHTSVLGDSIDGSPEEASQTGWVALNVTEAVYDYTSDILGTVPPTEPAGPHDATPGSGDENGPYYFSVPLGEVGSDMIVTIEGIKLRSDEYDTTLNGYVEILSPVSDNSWVQIII